jgi:hypothetical protein
MTPKRSGHEHKSHADLISAGLVLGVLLFACLLLLSSGGVTGESGESEQSAHLYPPEPEPVLLPPPPMDDEYFPCADCHEDEPPNPTVRKLEEHEHIVLAHGDLWCLDCHDADVRGSLHLSGSTMFEFEDSWRLCTRCHGNKLEDWRAGIHGKRTGSWRGRKEYRTCVTCHNPHAPRFEPVEPMPPPLRASEIRLELLSRQTEVSHEER